MVIFCVGTYSIFLFYFVLKITVYIYFSIDYLSIYLSIDFSTSKVIGTIN